MVDPPSSAAEEDVMPTESTWFRQRVAALERLAVLAGVVAALTRYRCHRNMLMLVAVDLGVSDATIYRWCADLAIAIDHYRVAKADSTADIPREAD